MPTAVNCMGVYVVRKLSLTCLARQHFVRLLWDVSLKPQLRYNAKLKTVIVVGPKW